MDTSTSEPRNWVLRKRGLFYRPKSQGYTEFLCEAGRYTESEAKQRADMDCEPPVTAHLASVFEPKPDKIMTAEEYLAANIKGWHHVCWNVDGCENVGVRYRGTCRLRGSDL